MSGGIGRDNLSDSTLTVLKIIKRLKNRDRKYNGMINGFFGKMPSDNPLGVAIAKLEENKIEARQVLIIIRNAIDEELEMDYSVEEEPEDETMEKVDSILDEM